MPVTLRASVDPATSSVGQTAATPRPNAAIITHDIRAISDPKDCRTSGLSRPSSFRHSSFFGTTAAADNSPSCNHPGDPYGKFRVHGSLLLIRRYEYSFGVNEASRRLEHRHARPCARTEPRVEQQSQGATSIMAANTAHRARAARRSGARAASGRTRSSRLATGSTRSAGRSRLAGSEITMSCTSPDAPTRRRVPTAAPVVNESPHQRLEHPAVSDVAKGFVPPPIPKLGERRSGERTIHDRLGRDPCEFAKRTPPSETCRSATRRIAPNIPSQPIASGFISFRFDVARYIAAAISVPPATVIKAVRVQSAVVGFVRGLRSAKRRPRHRAPATRRSSRACV